ncbi:hypothetical protein MVES_003350 [Malassezia vespertilionis]|uniref:Arrestin C-terminal-like domain-containing protein n=1 Tax=Malassezia vespertilionis TaxID=2020962 RepID=A0A2N1J7T7_9BASI|nr:hypothetical protein MVES_003350 [Malassezia vespertilionis]
MSPPRIILRPPPSRDFLQGYPGIPESETRPAAHLTGTIEIQHGSKQLSAAWLRVEMSKVETLPSGESWTELIGQGPIDVWQAAPSGNAADGEVWQTLPQRKFEFRVNVPEKLPPSLRLEKNGGISYQLVATMCVQIKRGFFRRTLVKKVLQDVRAIHLEKHELHSTWPLYNVPEDDEAFAGPFRARLYWNKRAYAALDPVEVRIIVYSDAPETVKLKNIIMSVRQTVTYLPDGKGTATTGDTARPSQQRTEVLVSKNRGIRKKIRKGEFLMYDLAITIPKNHTLMSVLTAKHIEVSHALRVAIEVGKERVMFEHIELQISGFSANVSESAMARIGHVPALCLTNEEPMDPMPSHETHPVFMDTQPTSPDYAAYAGYDQMMVDGGMEMPLLAQDAAFIGTPTPRGPLVFHARDSRIANERNSIYHDTEAASFRNQYMNAPSTRPKHMSLLPPQGMYRPDDVITPGGQVSPRPPMSEFFASPQRDGNYSRVSMYDDPSLNLAVPVIKTPARTSSIDAVQPARTDTNTVPPMRDALQGATANPGGAPPFRSAEAEKIRLFERARAEAEQYQQQYTHGAVFPGEERGDEPPAANSAPSTAQFSTAAEEKAALSARAQAEAAAAHYAERAAHAQEESVATPPPHAPSAASTPFLTRSEARAMEEKAKLQSHYALSESPSPPFVTAASNKTTSNLPMLGETAKAEGSAAPPPRPPKLPLAEP